MVSLERLYPSRVEICKGGEPRYRMNEEEVLESYVCDGGEKLYVPDKNGAPTPFADIADKLDPNDPSMDMIANFVWAGLLNENKLIALDDALSLIDVDMKGVIYTFQQLSKAIAQGLGIDEEEAVEAYKAKQAGDDKGKNLRGQRSKKQPTPTSA